MEGEKECLETDTMDSCKYPHESERRGPIPNREIVWLATGEW